MPATVVSITSGAWTAPTTGDLPAAAGTPTNCGAVTSGSTIYIRSTQAFKFGFYVDSAAAVSAFASTTHGRLDAGVWPIPTIGQTSTKSLFVERASGSADTSGLSYWSEG